MHILRRTLVSVFVMLLLVSSIFAQETVYELPAIDGSTLIEASFADTTTAQLYGFYASEGDSVTITMSPARNSDVDPYLLLFDGTTGELLVQNDDVTAGNLIASLDAVEIESDGAYMILATSLIYLDGTNTEIQDEEAYTLSIVGANVPNTVDDVTIIEIVIEQLSVNTAVAGISDDETPVAFMGFEAAEGDTIALTVDSEDFFTVIHLFAPDGTRLTTDASAIISSIDEDGVYLVVAGDLFFFEAGDSEGFFTGGAFTISLEGN